MTPDLYLAVNELQRLLNNILRVGTIDAVDHSANPARVRVNLGELVTDWLPYFEQRAGNTTTWDPPTVGEQAAVLAPGGHLGAALVLIGLNSTSRPAPSNKPNHTTTRYPDGAVVQYDHAAHALTASLPGGGSATLTAPASVRIISGHTTIDSPQTEITGHLRVAQNVSIGGGLAVEGAGSGGGTSRIKGNFEIEGGSLTHNGVNISSSHTHPDAHGGSTGGPQ